MKFDVVIIGGGLSGLISGISLAKAGKRVAVVSTGQSSLLFHSGSFDLLGYTGNGQEVSAPLDEIKKLNAIHPYSKVGNVEQLAVDAEQLLNEAGATVKGNVRKNHFRITPMGVAKPAWLTLDDYFTTEGAENLGYRNVLLVNVAGFLDFPVEFISDGLTNLGAKVNVKALQIPALKERRMSPSEMRSANIAKILASPDTLDVVAQKINTSLGDADVVLLPAIFGLNDGSAVASLRKKIGKPVYVLATLPPSVPGVRIQNLLVSRFKSLGGVFMLGNTVTGGKIADNRLTEIYTSNLPDESLVAENYILATGSFQSHGIVADYEKVYEPVFNLDVDYIAERPEWTKHNVFDAQPYMEFGVRTDNLFRALKGGVSLTNLYAVGSVLSGHNGIKNADDTGVSVITALAVSKTILKQN